MPPSGRTTDEPREPRPRPPREEIDPAALEIMRRHGSEVLAVARRWAETPEDAEDAYQRALEIMLTKAPSTDPDHLVPWLKTVVKREAWAVRRQRERHTPPAPEDSVLDSPAHGTAHDHAERFERLQVGAEAMRRLKPQEIRALVLKAEGLSYREICAETGWTYTKVNRCLSEGRRRFHDRLAGIESGAECERLAPLLSALADGEARAEDMAALRPHLRTCLVCRARLRDYRAVTARVAAVAPPVVGGSLLASARDLFHGAAGWISERSASLSLRWHQAAELAAGHKVAAVAASTAVLAGGGAATVATVDGGDRPAAVRPAAGSSLAPSPPAPRGDESAKPRDTTASGSGMRGQTPPKGETRAADRDPAPTARPAGESSAPSPSAGEFTPDPAPAEPRATKPDGPGRPAAPEPEDGGEFSP
jgi:RNA polymerase sigma factor (sigma-70 family)